MTIQTPCLAGELVREHLRTELDRARAGDVRLISWPGQGRDVIGVLAGHPRRDDGTLGWSSWTGHARWSSGAAGLDGVEVLQADAGSPTPVRSGARPVVVACGSWHISDSDIHATVTALPSLSRPVRCPVDQASQPPDLTPAVRSWFEDAGFARRRSTSVTTVSCRRAPTDGRARLVDARKRLFTFAART